MKKIKTFNFYVHEVLIEFSENVIIPYNYSQFGMVIRNLGKNMEGI